MVFNTNNRSENISENKGVKKDLKKFRSKLAIFLIGVLLIGTVMPTGLFAADIGFLDDPTIDYNDNVPADADSAVPVTVAPNLTISAEDGEVFSGGNIKFDIEGGSDPLEKLSLPNGTYELEDGKEIEIIDGVIYMDSNGDGDLDDPGEDIARVNEILNGDGTSLQIDFSTIPIPNGDFEQGDLGIVDESNTIPNWSINTSSEMHDGTSVDQIWLGELATKTQGTLYDSVEPNGDGTYTVTGTDIKGNKYSYVTDMNYNERANPSGSSDHPNVEGFEAEFEGWTSGQDRTGYVQEVYDTDTSNGQALELGFLWAHLKTGDYAKDDGQIATSFGAEAVSDPFEAHAGDQLGFDWKANAGGDDYEVYGFLVKLNENDGSIEEYTEILYGRGLNKDWTTNAGVITEDGTYQFRFVAGSFNRTDGTSHGATLSIDNIRILSGKVVASIAEQIGQLVEYQTTDLLGDRNVNITVTNGTGGVSEAEAVPIKMDNEVERSITIETPTVGEIVYNPTPTITGKVMPGSDVQVKVTGPDGYMYTRSATVADTVWEIDAIDQLTVPGEYTISVTASIGEMETDPAVTSTFNFVSKVPLEDYKDNILPTIVSDEETYRSGWPEYQTALKTAAEVIAQIDDETAGERLTQEEVDNALANLQTAVDALEKHPPEESEPAEYEHGDNKITIDFDKDVVLTDDSGPSVGFTVTVDGEEYLVTNAIANGDKVTLTVEGTLNSDAEEVIVDYDGSSDNLYGDELNGSADETFSIVATDEFGAGLQIETTIGDTDDRTPSFTGTAHQDAVQVILTFKDSKGNIVEGLENIEAGLNGGSWTYNISNALEYGDYTVEATAFNGESSRTVTKSATFTVVDKTDLEAAIEEGQELEEDDHRAGWEEFARKLDEAQEVIDNPTASQEEVNAAITELEATRDALEKHPPVAETASFEHDSTTITIDYDKAVTFEDGAINPTKGFTVTMDSEPLEVVGAEVEGDKVTLTLADGTKLSSDEEIEITYNEANGESNLVGNEENGSPTEDATFNAYDEFGAALHIESTKGNTDDRTTPFTGDVHEEADNVTITIVDSEGNDVVTNAEAFINGTGWVFEDAHWLELDPLTPGDYTVYVTSEDTDTERTVTKSAAFTVVDKESLERTIDRAHELDENNHRAGWEEFIDKLDDAQEVFSNPTASQEEVQSASDDLLEARDALEKHPPEAINATFDHGFDQITIEFDKDVYFANNEVEPEAGFMVIIDGVEVEIIATELVKADPESKTNKVRLTLEEGTALSSDADVKVYYNQESASANLYGDEENGTAVEDFTFQADDPFGHALQIDDPNGITNDLTPIIEGTADVDADHATITIIYPDGEEIIVDEDDLTIDENGTWTYNVEQTLTSGEYKVEVTTSQSGRPDVTKDHYFTVVDKTDLIATDDEITKEELVEDEYTEDSWGTLVDTLEHAREVIAEPNATQLEVDQANSELGEAYRNLVYKQALADEEKKSEKLQSEHYSQASWEAYQEALERAQDVLGNPSSSQTDVDEALDTLEAARKALTVDKTLLEAEENKSKELNIEDYSETSWAIYQEALAKAQAVLNDPNATQEEIDKAEEELATARAALTVDKASLKEEEAKSDDLNASDHTNDSWKAYQDALKKAQEVLADKDASQSDVDEALATLKDASEALIQVEEPLPDTATSLFNWLLIGAVTLLIGITILQLQHRRRKGIS
ncbi:hypothetical protein GI584_15335 [Gracilibacillus salitolerans]|uniref:Bacterial Ig-like domain-containing protein n=1 Tax=Gracilibacillus salitolerans TaxID=2663022 RepID=A0A5Q2TK76_9BACI|nr:SwmB domain-containing protein [Gracilibacillus salitolerans]QGH35339.1 hypothetical protein GI584_15335 [Gracilibacillus salitolerans]